MISQRKIGGNYLAAANISALCSADMLSRSWEVRTGSPSSSFSTSWGNEGLDILTITRFLIVIIVKIDVRYLILRNSILSVYRTQTKCGKRNIMPARKLGCRLLLDAAGNMRTLGLFGAGCIGVTG